MTLAEQLAAAEAAVIAPRQRASELEAELTRAVSLGEYARAEKLKDELHAATEALVIAEAAVRALAEGAARAEQERAAATRQIAEAWLRDQAERDVEAARADETKRTGQMHASVAAMREALAEAQQHLRSATAFQDAVSNARNAQIDARRRRGDWPASHPGPTPCRANEVAVLIEHDELVAALARWSK
jgi:hypothetical protein